MMQERNTKNAKMKQNKGFPYQSRVKNNTLISSGKNKSQPQITKKEELKCRYCHKIIAEDYYKLQKEELKRNRHYIECPYCGGIIWINGS